MWVSVGREKVILGVDGRRWILWVGLVGVVKIG